MNGRYFHIFMTICLIAMVYGFGNITQSQTNLTTGSIVHNEIHDVLKVDTVESRAVLGVSERVLQSASRIGKTNVDRNVLNNLVQVALDDPKLDVASMVDVDALAISMGKAGGSSKPIMASDAEIFIDE